MKKIEKQVALFDVSEFVPKEQRYGSNRNNDMNKSANLKGFSKSRAKNAISSYSNLMGKLDQDLTNQNWEKIDTAKITSSKANYNFVDLFSGARGMSKGFVDAGFNKLLSIEINKYASDTIRKNFSQSVHIEKPIEEITAAELHQ